MTEDIDSFLRFLSRERGLAGSTLDAYGSDLTHFRSFVGEQGVERAGDVGRHHIAGYLLALKQRGRAPATISRHVVSVRAFFRFLVKSGRLAADPSLYAEAPKPEKRAPGILSEARIADLLQAPGGADPAGIRDKAMLETLYATGLRVSELVALDERDLHLELGYVRCTGAGGKERIVPLGRQAREALARYVAEVRGALLGEDAGNSGGEPALFLNLQGTRMTRQGFWKLIKKYAEAAGLDGITPHTLRRSFAAHLLARGADLRSVQELMGHAGAAATQAYAQPTKNRMKDVYDNAHPRAK